MQRTAAYWVALALGLTLTHCAAAQITAQPARPFTPSVPSGSAPNNYPPSYAPASYSVPGYGSTSPHALSGNALLQSPEANQIRGWYRDYLGRDVGPDLGALVNLLRGGMSTTDLQATILGSDEFYTQKGRDPQTFVRDTLQSVTWSEPSYADVRRWTDRLTQLRGDRFALAREILLSTLRPPSEASELTDIASRLVAAARLADDTVDFELGGTPQGRQANLQAQALSDAATQLQRAATSSRPDDVNWALGGAERAYQALQSTLSNPSGTAPSASGIVRRIGTMLSDARRATGSVSVTPSATPPASIPPFSSYPPLSSTLPPLTSVNGSSPDIVLDQVSAARRATESLIQTLTSEAYQDYTYNVVLRDLDTLAARLAALEPVVRSGASRDRLQVEVQSLADSANRVQSQLTTGRLPYSARLYWQSLQSSLAQLRDTLGVAATSPSTVLRPTPTHDSLLPLIDQAAAQIDVFLAATMPLVTSIPDLPSVQSDARSLKNRVLTLRQQAGAGQPAPALKQTLNGMIGDYQDAFDRWNRIVTTYRLNSPARLSSVGETLNRVEQLINEALASGNLTPQGPSRATQDLAQLNGEVSETRRILAAFTGYPEQPLLEGYLEQVAGYVVQINDALGRQSTGDARRLAVGMQGVIGRMQPQFDSLNQRLASAAALDQRQRVTDLQARAYRLGRLADDVEAQLY